MTISTKYIVWAAALMTVFVLILWRATGGDFYTKFEVIAQVEKEIDPNDPLAAAGFYDGDSKTETISRSEFRMGLLPTPSGIFDKHIVSVVSVSIPAWVIAMSMLLVNRRRQKAKTQTPERALTKA
jgi:hypothetical protein